MSYNKYEDYGKTMNYMNKIAKFIYADSDEDRQEVATLMYCLTFKLKAKKIVV
jgi:hypothetical protein